MSSQTMKFNGKHHSPSCINVNVQILRVGLGDSHQDPPGCPRPPDSELLPASQLSVTIGNVDLGQKKDYKTCL